MPRPNRDLELFSVYLPRADLEALRAVAENMTGRGEIPTTVADLIRGMVRVGLGALEVDEELPDRFLLTRRARDPG